MLAAGIKVGPQESSDEPKKKVVYDNKKKKPRNDKVSTSRFYFPEPGIVCDTWVNIVSNRLMRKQLSQKPLREPAFKRRRHSRKPRRRLRGRRLR
jgi:hypothetical protein